MNLNVSEIVLNSSKLLRSGLDTQLGDKTGKIVILVPHVVIVLVNTVLNSGFGLLSVLSYNSCTDDGFTSWLH